jgi:hypothetical protein
MDMYQQRHIPAMQMITPRQNIVIKVMRWRSEIWTLARSFAGQRKMRTMVCQHEDLPTSCILYIQSVKMFNPEVL